MLTCSDKSDIFGLEIGNLGEKAFGDGGESRARERKPPPLEIRRWGRNLGQKAWPECLGRAKRALKMSGTYESGDGAGNECLVG